jgi:hypothetical protein
VAKGNRAMVQSPAISAIEVAVSPGAGAETGGVAFDG